MDMTIAWRREERLMWKLVGTGSRRGAAPASRAGDVLRQPWMWAIFAAALALSGPRGRRAALRGVSCSAAAGLVHLPLKAAFGRPRPWGGRLLKTRRHTSSFPSGHTASDLSFVFGASQELPLALVPLSLATMASHWSLVRSRIHYPSDVIGGGAVALTVAVAAWKLCPPRNAATRRLASELGAS